MYTLSYGETPKSLNAGGTGSRRHWAVGYQEKKRWENIWHASLLEARVPKHMNCVTITAVLRFPTAHRRDVENYRSSLVKPLADALVSGGWIPDDTAEFFNLARLVIASERGRPMTMLTLYPECSEVAA